MKSGGILLRVSRETQASDDKTSYAVQLTQSLAYAGAHDIDVPNDKDHIWQEVGSRGNFYTREGLQQALKAIEQGRIQALIVWKLDRLTDDVIIFNRIYDQYIVQRYAELWSATEPDVNLTTKDGYWLALTKMHFTIAPERKTFALRVNENRKQKLKQGIPWVSGWPRYGYRWVQDPVRTVERWGVTVFRKEKLAADPETAPVVQQVFAWGDVGKTIDWIAQALSGFEEGGRWRKPTPYAHSGTAGANPHGVWGTAVVGDILKFPGYYGRWPGLRTKRVPRNDGSERYKQVKIPEAEWTWIEPSPAPALVTPEQWERAQQRLRDNKLYSPRTHDAEGNPIRKFGADDALLYGGMARCGVIREDGTMCNHRVEPRFRGKAYTRKDGTRPMQYRCAAERHTRGSCKGVFINEAVLDKAVIAALAETLASPENIARLAKRSQQDALVKAGDLKVTTPIDDYRVLQKRLLKETGRLDYLISLSSDPELDEPTRHGYKLKVMQQTAEIQGLEEDCERARKAAEQYKRVEEVVADIEHYLKQWDLQTGLMLLGGYTPTTLRKCLEALGARVIVHPHSEDPAQLIATLQLHLTRLDFGARVDGEQGVVDVPVHLASSRLQRPSKQFLAWVNDEQETEDKDETVSSSSPRAAPVQAQRSIGLSLGGWPLDSALSAAT